MSRNGLKVALILPLVVLALGIARAEYHLAHARVWSFEVAGYDPRDLLRGHYLNYRLVLDEGSTLQTCDDGAPDCCLCLTGGASDAAPKVQHGLCSMSAENHCDGVLQTSYLPTLRRYYIPEAQAQKITERFREAAGEHTARLLVAIDATGKPQVQALLVAGERIERVKPKP